MNICIVNWPMSSVGGITTYGVGLRNGLQRLGHTVSVVDAVCSNRKPLLTSEFSLKVISSQYSIVSGKLGYGSSVLKDTINRLNKFDLLVFLHPCPRANKENLKKADYWNWTELYHSTKPDKTTIFHDIRWEDWGIGVIDKVADSMDIVFGAQPAYTKTLESYPSHSDTLPFPMILNEDPPEYTGEFDWAWFSQWRPLKGIQEVLDLIPRMDGTIDLFNIGIEYFYARHREDWYTKIIRWDERYAENGTGKAYYWGLIPHEDVLVEMGRHKRIIDLQGIRGKAYAGGGSFNYTLTEALWAGSLPVVHRSIVASNYVPCEFVRIIDKADEMLGMEGEQECREEARNWVRQEFDSVNVARKLLSYFE